MPSDKALELPRAREYAAFANAFTPSAAELNAVSPVELSVPTANEEEPFAIAPGPIATLFTTAVPPKSDQPSPSPHA